MSKNVQPYTYPSTIHYYSTTAQSTNPLTTTPRPECFFEHNIFYSGVNLAEILAPTASDCCQLCKQNSLCLSFSFLVDVNYCYLKYSTPIENEKVNLNNIISGVLNSASLIKNYKSIIINK